MRRARARRWRQGTSPATVTCPPLGTRMPVSILMVVLFQAPLGPMYPPISPALHSLVQSGEGALVRTTGVLLGARSRKGCGKPGSA